MDYVASILVENYNMERLRAFPDEASARRYVERLDARLARLCNKGMTRMFVTYVTVHLVKPSGVLSPVAIFDGSDEGCRGSWRN